MKLNPLKNSFTNFKELKLAVKKYGIIDFSQKTLSQSIKDFEKKGLDLESDLSDLFSTDTEELFVILKHGVIQKSVIHIVDISSWPENWKYPKFHIYKCEKIKEMQDKGRKHRYKASSGKNNKFYLIKKDKQWNETLEICSYCLNKYNNQNNSNKTKQNFPLNEWIQAPMVKSNKFSDIDLDICTIPNRYLKEWSEISKTRKEQESYICQTCRKDFSNKLCKEFLHTHHINADKRNNLPENLKVLCIECHSKEPYHSHIKQSLRYKKWLKSECF